MRYRKGYKYQLAENEAIRVGLMGYKVEHDWFNLEDGVLYVRAGYCWDGASGVALDTPDFMRGSIAHDCLYQAMREKLLPLHMRERADQALVDVCKADGMPWWRRCYVYRAVRWFGKESASQPKETITAP